MISRFQGPNGRRHLRDTLSRNPAITVASGALDDLCSAVIIKEHPAGSILITQGGHDNDMAFLLAGEVEILVHNRQVATRHPPNHIGEMTAIDPSAQRAATVRAIQDTVAAWVDEPVLATIADAHPALWRHFAQEVASRLRQRNNFVRPRTERPRIFIGSSTELVSVVAEIKQQFQYDPFDVYSWTEIFPASGATMAGLQNEAKKADFAIFCLGAEDQVISRNTTKSASRDNVLFELGLFAGQLGIERCFMLRDDQGAPHIPSDLLGLTQVGFRRRSDKTPDLMGPMNQFRYQIRELGTR